MNYQKILEEIQEEIKPFLSKGKVADYIPALKNVDENRFAMSIQLFDGTSYHIGDSEYKFSIQSISKVFSFVLALKHHGKKLYARVGHEPSGDPFNSLVLLENENGIPRNPFINSGAIVIDDVLYSMYRDKTFETILEFIQNVADDKTIRYDKEILVSELEHGYRNFSLINLIKSYENIENNVDSIIETYFKQCSINMSTKSLAKAFLFLANHGENPITNEQILTQSKAKRINSVMLTCGHYDASGDFAYKVGLPGKSGVSGGVVAIIPKVMSLCAYSPKLNSNGNSIVATKALELFTTKTGLSIF